jgi:tetratricopeptide (TPR) repeat protein
MDFLRNWRASLDRKRARALEGEGYAGPAAQAYEEALARATGTDRVPSLLGLARCSLRTGRLARARQAAAEATVLSPRAADAWHLLGLANLELRDTVGADEALHRALECEPGRIDVLHTQAEYYALKFPQAAFEAGKRVIRLLLDRPADAERLSFPRELPLVFLRNLAAEQRFGDEAAAYFDELAAAPDAGWIRPHALLQKGILLANLGRIPDAVRAYQAALAADPELDAAHFDLGIAHAKQRDFESARTAFAIYAKKHPTSPLATYGFGFIAETQPDVPDLIRLYRTFLERMASAPPAPSSLGRLDIARGWLDHVRSVLEHAERHRAEQHDEPETPDAGDPRLP